MSLVAKYAGREDVAPNATIEELGLSSLERVELMVALEDKFQTRIDEGAFAERAKRRRPARRSSRRAPPASAAAGRAGRVSQRGIARGRRAPSGASACRRGFCRSRASLPGCASRAASTSRESTDR